MGSGTLPRAQEQGQLPVYGASVEVVRLHVAVLDDGLPVTDLTARDFVVIDNGVEHEVALALTPTDSPLLGLVRDPLVADYHLYVDAEDPDLLRPGALESRLELYNYTDQRLWRDDMDVADLEDAEELIGSVDRTLARLEGWLLKGR
jgi:hypothetical protein